MSLQNTVDQIKKRFSFARTPAPLVDVSEAYSPSTEKSSEGPIPRRFIQTWKTSKFDPEHAERLIRFRKENPGFDFEFYDDVAADEYMSSKWGDHPIYGIYQNLRYGAAKADVWRYCNLYDLGGTYLDIDSAINVNLNELVLDAPEVLSYEGNLVTDFLDEEHCADFNWFKERGFEQKNLSHPNRPILNWCLVFSPQHPILKNVIDLIVKNSEFYNGKAFSSVQRATVNFTGPMALTRAVWDYADSNPGLKQMGIDFEGKAEFKDLPEDANSVYRSSLQDSYHKQKKKKVLDKSIRLNLGCGGDIKAGYINIDAVPQKPEVVAMDVRKLTYEEESIDEIYAKDVLEHLGYPDATKALESWCKVLKSGGELFIQTISLEKITEAYQKGIWGVREVNYMMFSGVSWHGGEPSWNSEHTTEFDWHKSIFDLPHLSKTLDTLGFDIVRHEFDPLDDLKKKPYKHNLNMYIWAVKR